LLASQYKIKAWHQQIGFPTLADAILDRLVHNAHKLELEGESLRKDKHPANTESAWPGSELQSPGCPPQGETR
jgi:DNA replication protein DnaC